jgi:uncharacterized integral membrane protein
VFYLILVLFVIVGSALTVITVQNLATSVQLTLFGLKTPGIPPGLLIFLSFLSGALLLYLIAIVSARHDQRRLKKLRQRVKELEQEKQQPPQMAMNTMNAMQQPMTMPATNMQPPMNMQPHPMQQPMTIPSANMQPMNMPPPPTMTPPNSNMQPQSPMNMPPPNSNMQQPMNMPQPDGQLPANMPSVPAQPRPSIIKMPGLGPMQN